MKVICIKKINGDALTIGKIYEVLETYRFSAQDNILKIRPYSGKLSEVLNNVSASLDSSTENPYKIINDNGDLSGYNIDMFITVEDNRDKILNDLLNESNLY